MRGRVFHLVFVLSVGALALGAAPQPPDPSFIVHEWGTFTSIAGVDGAAVQWRPLSGSTDLPCFVERSPLQFKGDLIGTVRMETPVLYFYSPHPVDASVSVAFPRGFLTEWYPHAQYDSGIIAWPSVAVRPGGAEAFPVESSASHYYAARRTTSAPVGVGPQTEKFLFYRGVGAFQPPLSAIAHDDGRVTVRNRRGAPAGDVILFENRGGAMTFTSGRFTSAAAVLPRAALDDASGPPLAELKRLLVANGLYEQEAQAMIDTWKDSWFEEGARLLYIVPRAEVDEILPLTMSPKPGAVTRVFVGRIELMTPATLRDVRAAITSRDRAAMLKYGRFLLPIADRLGLSAALPPGLVTASRSAPCR
jgi:hypothetical protein